MPRSIALPTSQDTLVTQTVPLDGRDFVLTFDWTPRTDSWALKIQDAEGNTLSAGGQLVPYINLLRHIADDERPGGILVHFPGAFGTIATRDTINQGSLLYYEVSELG